MSDIISTSGIGVDADCTVHYYVPPNVVKATADGTTVSYGEVQTLEDGAPLSAGTWEIQGGTAFVSGSMRVRAVTITSTVSKLNV